ncbi:ArsR family transcriptional regulator [Paractinoplanes toevensis]|uniref:ArsR family transcriptional regulator n=1 Tax=Paractinoplanes toevensis TaxID=571911 RepID=A0A919T536_9ACTN|nr:ArsR family transcriptional regulator [Actinoplanes toevensis]
MSRRRQNTSRLLPLLRSPLLGELMAWICLHPEMNYSLPELARRFKVSRSAIGKEADRLAEAGLVRSEWRGNLRLLRAEPANPLVRPLTEVLALTYGPIAVLADLLPAVPGLAEAYLYGSWAARYAGEPGPPPQEVDVLVVGDVDESDLAGAADAAEHQLGRPVNIYRVSSMEWRWPERDPFLMWVRASPAFALVGAPR